MVASLSAAFSCCVPVLLLRFRGWIRWRWLIRGPFRYVGNIRRVGDLPALGVTKKNASMIKQQPCCPVQFDFSFFVQCLGRDERNFGLRHGRLILQYQG